MKRVLLLVLLLDRSATDPGMPPGLPLLLDRRTGGIKTSAELLAEFHRLWLDAEVCTFISAAILCGLLVVCAEEV